MKTIITAREMPVTPSITERIEKKTSRMNRYLLSEQEMYIHMTRMKNGERRVEITLPMGNGVLLRAEGHAKDNLFMAIDEALEHIERQIHKHRTKLGRRLRTDAFAQAEPEFIEEGTVEEGEKKIVRYKTFPVRPMSVEDAIVQMELLGHDFFVFVNVDSGRTNVLYQRKDGDLGLMEPEA